MTYPNPSHDNRSTVVRHRGRWLVLVFALVVAVVAGIVIINVRRAADAVEATTTAADEVRPTPPVLGSKQFEVKLSDRPGADPVVVAAGPGFAVLVDNTVTSYSPEGAERWHYRRTDTDITNVRAYDRGAVLIAALADNNTLVAFDANTGQQLWTSQDKDLRGAFDGYTNKAGNDLRRPPPALFLALHKFGRQMIGFDPRTGSQAWSQSIGCANTAYTPTQMVCLNVFGDHIRAAVIDSATGTRTADLKAPIPGAGQPQTWVFLTPRLVTSGQGVVMGLWFSTTRPNVKVPSQTVYLNTTTGASVNLDVEDAVATGDDERGDFLISEIQDSVVTAVTLNDSQGAPRCTFTPAAAPTTAADRPATVWLHDQIVSVIDHGDSDLPKHALSTFDRDCRQLSSVPAPANTTLTDIIPAHGATIVVRSDGTGTHIDGYAPR